MKKITVIITSYNIERYIAQCLDSIINQTLQDIEIICIDDCSTDNTYSILKQYNNDNITILQNEKNYGGPSIGVNKGIKLSKAEYIYIMDGDDYLSNDFLEKLYITAKKYNSDIVTNANVMRIDVDKDTFKESNPYSSNYTDIEKWKNESKDDYLEGKSSANLVDIKYSKKDYFNLVPWSRIVRKDFLINNNLEFMPILDGCEGSSEDFHFAYRLMLNNPNISYNNESKYYHRLYNTSLFKSIADKPMMLTAVIKRMRNLIEYCKEKSPDHLQNIELKTWYDTYNRYNMIKNKEKIYNYMHEYALSLNLQEKDMNENAFNNYMLIRLIENFDQYYFIFNKFNKLNSNINNLNKKIDSIINTLASWIPVKKWRNNFKKKLMKEN